MIRCVVEELEMVASGRSCCASEGSGGRAGRGGGIGDGGLGPVLLRKRGVRRAAEKMGVSSFARARLAREDGGKGTRRLITGFVGGAGGQSVRGGRDGGGGMRA